MHPEQIKAHIRMAGTTPAVIAEELGLARSTVSQVISGRGVSARVQRRISEVTGLAIDVMWPQKKTVLRRIKAATALSVK